VLIIDRAEFPRYKTCGGGLVGVSRSIIPDSVRETIEVDISEVIFTLRGKDPVRVSRRDPFLGMTRRDTFDNALLHEAIRAGAAFIGELALKRVMEQQPGLVTLETSRGSLVSRAVVGADGTSGRTGRYVGVTAERVDLGLEEEVEVADPSRRSVVRLDWGPGPGSYGWVFPKRTVDTIGVIETKGNADRTRTYLEGWVDQQPTRDAPKERSTGHLTQWRTSDSPLRRGSVVVAGDAAGLLEPWTREGISFALRSGVLAGRAAAHATVGEDRTALDLYAVTVEKELQPEIRVGAILLSVFEKRPELVHWLLKRSRRARNYFVEFCTGETSLGDLERHRWFIRAIRKLA